VKVKIWGSRVAFGLWVGIWCATGEHLMRRRARWRRDAAGAGCWCRYAALRSPSNLRYSPGETVAKPRLMAVGFIHLRGSEPAPDKSSDTPISSTSRSFGYRPPFQVTSPRDCRARVGASHERC